jgi:hypothetical protein
MISVNKDSVTVSVNKSYAKASFLRKILMGKNYRKEWAVPVKMPIFKIAEFGFKPTEMGGGQQTTSLQMTDKDGRAWVLRSVDKKVKPVALPKPMRFSLAVNFLQEMVSASHPYAALPIGYMATAARVIAPRPVLYFVPDDPNLGKFRPLIKNTVCFLEQKEPTPDDSETENTDKVMEEIIEENDHLILQEQVLKARLLDMLVADWDRHADQWRWGSYKFRGDNYYYAIPRDRDQAFFQSNGWLPLFIRIFGAKHINNFRKESDRLKNLNFKSWSFDKTFLNELDASAWQKTIQQFQASLSDSVIEAAVKNLPHEVYAIGGDALTKKLINRRNTLPGNAMKYYNFISGTVHVLGTDEEELFEVRGAGDSLNVSVYRFKNEQKGKLIYERRFLKRETSLVSLAGLNGSDKFFMAKDAASTIRLQITGGSGNNVYDLGGNIRTSVQDKKPGDRFLNKGSGITLK